jgi:DNA helicase-2/ATP-dependent DNA helicase PcrA
LPSRFVDELPPVHIEATSVTGYGGQAKVASRWDKEGVDFGFRADPKPRVSTPHRPTPAPKPEGKNLIVGARVFHMKFGYGHVTAVEGNKLMVNFEHSGEKKVIDSFVERA